MTTQTYDDPYVSAAAVTPSDTVDLPVASSLHGYGNHCRALWIGGAGTGALSVVMSDGTTGTFAGVPVGLLKIRCRRVNATGTGVTNIVALY